MLVLPLWGVPLVIIVNCGYEYRAGCAADVTGHLGV